MNTETPEKFAYIKTLLPQVYTSEDHAYLVDDYPYGFRLRCKIRYWVDYSQRHGWRLVSQTTNPKREGTHWNKPKAGTYSELGMVIGLDHEDHVIHASVSKYDDVQTLEVFMSKFGAVISDGMRDQLATFIKAKKRFEEKLATGEVYFTINGQRV